MMKTFLLLILSLMTGCEVSSEESTVKGCEGGWVEFTCKYPKTYQSIAVVIPNETTIRSTLKDDWENKGRVSLYHDTKNEKLRVAIKQLQSEDSGEYECKFDQRSHSSDEEVKLKVEKDGCQKPVNETAYRTAKTTFACDFSGNKYKSKFFCKENGFICEDILPTKSSLKSNGTFTLTETNSGFNVSISNVSSYHAGVYWCGGDEGSYRTALRKITLEVKDIITVKKSATVGQTFTYWCEYPNGALIKKFICKGEDPSICQHLVSTAQLNKTTGRFSMKEDRGKRNITITVREVTADDTGTYWCGAESTDNRHSNPFFTRLMLTVVPPATSTPSIISSASPHPVATSSVSSTQSATAGSSGGSWLTYRRLLVTVVVVVCVAVLGLVLLLVLIYKRFERSKNTRNGEAQNNKEDQAYDEIQECPQKPDSGTALKSIYVTANFPTNPSASQHYSNMNFQNSSGEVSGHTYSTVRDNDQYPTCSTVNHPSRLSADPFYSTVNNPQQH